MILIEGTVCLDFGRHAVALLCPNFIAGREVFSKRKLNRGRKNELVRRGHTNGGTRMKTRDLWTYNDGGEPLTESYASGPLNGINITNAYDQFLESWKTDTSETFRFSLGTMGGAGHALGHAPNLANQIFRYGWRRQ